ncbi:MAG: MBL fold metallo-hydrolase [Candidatus Saccharimonadales bacterium]
MEFQFYGANCIKIVTKKVNIVIDDNLAALGGKSVASPKDIVLSTGSAELPADAHFKINQPGEYEVSDISVQGIAARSHMDEEKQHSATMYRIIIDGVRIVVTGHIYPELNDVQLEALGTVDILFVPVGGHGYTLDAIGAQKIVKDIEPKVVIPTHYDSKSLKFEVPQSPLDDAVKILGMEVFDTLDSLKMKNFELGEGTRLVVLNQQ